MKHIYLILVFLSSLSVFAQNPLNASFKVDGIRIFGPNAITSKDMEPEYVTISDDYNTTWVVCQENNSVVIANLATNTILDSRPLGYKNHNIAGNVTCS